MVSFHLSMLQKMEVALKKRSQEIRLPVHWQLGHDDLINLPVFQDIETSTWDFYPPKGVDPAMVPMYKERVQEIIELRNGRLCFIEGMGTRTYSATVLLSMAAEVVPASNYKPIDSSIPNHAQRPLGVRRRMTAQSWAYGYWKFHCDRDLCIALSRGYYAPELVIKAYQAGAQDTNDIILSWVIGKLEGSAQHAACNAKGHTEELHNRLKTFPDLKDVRKAFPTYTGTDRCPMSRPDVDLRHITQIIHGDYAQVPEKFRIHLTQPQSGNTHNKATSTEKNATQGGSARKPQEIRNADKEEVKNLIDSEPSWIPNQDDPAYWDWDLYADPDTEDSYQPRPQTTEDILAVARLLRKRALEQPLRLDK